MNENIATLRFQDAWRESWRHVHHLRLALTALQALLPFNAESFQQLTDEQIKDLDQFVFRFSKLQDCMGVRLFPALLECLEEPYDQRPMLDKLNRLEKLGFIESVENWQKIRVIRNKFAHDYPDDNERNAQQINRACEAAVDLMAMLERVEVKFHQSRN